MIGAVTTRIVAWFSAFATWFAAIDATTRAAIISAVGIISSGIISATIAVFGFRLSARTSRDLNIANAEVAKAIKDKEIQHSARVRIAEARIEWIEKFREDAAELYRALREIALRKANSDGDDDDSGPLYSEEELELYSVAVSLKSKLLMRIDPNSQIPEEVELEKLLRKSQPDKTAESSRYRRDFRKLTRAVLNAEWKKAKSEINQTSTETKVER